MKFTKAGEIAIAANLSLRAEDATTVRFEIRDTGIGIPAHRLGTLFQPFAQVDSSNTREFGGTGLGLSIVRKLVGLMNGESGVESTVGIGSRFWFTARFAAAPRLQLPQKAAVAAPNPLRVRLVADHANDREVHAADLERATSEDAPRMGALHMTNILVAEDNLVNQKVVRKILENMGFRATIVDDGRAAVDAWKSQGFDLILMDCQMPQLDGYRATAEIRRCEAGARHIPIIALTAHAMNGSDETCRAAGMDDHLTKPIDRKRLEATLERFLPTDRARAASDLSTSARL